MAALKQWNVRTCTCVVTLAVPSAAPFQRWLVIQTPLFLLLLTLPKIEVELVCTHLPIEVAGSAADTDACTSC